jgi:hypothetical protein
MLTNLWYSNTSTVASGLSTLNYSMVSGWSQVVTEVVVSGHIPSDAGEFRPGYDMLIKLLALYSRCTISVTVVIQETLVQVVRYNLILIL